MNSSSLSTSSSSSSSILISSNSSDENRSAKRQKTTHSSSSSTDSTMQEVASRTLSSTAVMPEVPEGRGYLEAFLKSGNLTVTQQNFNDLVRAARIHGFSSVLELCDVFYTEDSLSAAYHSLRTLNEQNGFVDFICSQGLPKTKIRLQTILDRIVQGDELSLESYRLYLSMAQKSGSKVLQSMCCDLKYSQFYPQLTQHETSALASLFNNDVLPNNYTINDDNVTAILPFAFKNNVRVIYDHCVNYYTEEKTKELIEACADLVQLEDLTNLMCDNGLRERFNLGLNSHYTSARVETWLDFFLVNDDAEVFKRCIRIAHKSESRRAANACACKFNLYNAIIDAPEAQILATFLTRDLSIVRFEIADFRAAANFDKRYPISVMQKFDDIISKESQFQYNIGQVTTLADFVYFIDLVYDRKLDKTITAIETVQFNLYRNEVQKGITFSEADLPTLIQLANKYPDRPKLREKLLTLFKEKYQKICDEVLFLPAEWLELNKLGRAKHAARKASTAIHETIFTQAKLYGFHDLAKSVYNQILKDAMALTHNFGYFRQELKLKMALIENNISYLIEQFPDDPILKLIAHACNRHLFSAEQFTTLFESVLSRYCLDRFDCVDPCEFNSDSFGAAPLEKLIENYKLIHHFAETSENQFLLDYVYDRMVWSQTVYRAVKEAKQAPRIIQGLDDDNEADQKLFDEVRQSLYPMLRKEITQKKSSCKDFTIFDSQFNIPLEKTKYNDKISSDIILKLKSGTKLFVHRDVLIAHSQVFAAMFRRGFYESERPDLVLPGVKSEEEQKVESEEQEIALYVTPTGEIELDIIEKGSATKKKIITIQDDPQHEAAFIAMIQYFYSNQIEMRRDVAVHILQMIDKYEINIKLPIYAQWNNVIRDMDLNSEEAATCIDWALAHRLNLAASIIERRARIYFESAYLYDYSQLLEKYGHLLKKYEGRLGRGQIQAFCRIFRNIEHLDLTTVDLSCATATQFAQLQELQSLELGFNIHIDLDAVEMLRACPKLIYFSAFDFQVLGSPITDVGKYVAKLKSLFPKFTTIRLTAGKDRTKWNLICEE